MPLQLWDAQPLQESISISSHKIVCECPKKNSDAYMFRYVEQKTWTEYMAGKKFDSNQNLIIKNFQISKWWILVTWFY